MSEINSLSPATHFVSNGWTNLDQAWEWLLLPENPTYLVPELGPKTRIMILEHYTILSILTVEIKDDGFGQSLRAVIVVARTCKFSVAMLSVETFNFHGISRLSRDNFFETTIDQLTILPPTDTASWTSFEKKRPKKIIFFLKTHKKSISQENYIVEKSATSTFFLVKIFPCWKI